MTAPMVAEARPTRNLHPIDSKLIAMAHYLQQRAVRDSRWGQRFIDALDRGLAYHQQGMTVKRLSRGVWSAPSKSRPFVTHLCNRWACDCEAYQQGDGAWCWHRAMVLLHEVEREFDQVHGLTACDGKYNPTANYQPSYRISVDLGG